MTNKLSYFRLALCATFSLLFSTNIFGSHIVGADLYYTHVSGNTYTITFAAYGDCGPMSAAAFSTLPISSPQVCIFDGTTYTMTANLVIQPPDSGVEVTPLCPGDTSQCTSTSSSIPGVKKFVYTATITLPYTSATWRFIYNGSNGPGSVAGRAAAITNLYFPNATTMQLIDTLNNVTAANSNPVLTVAQQTFFCLDNLNTYSPVAVDPDGDALAINLIVATNGNQACDSVGSPILYLPGTDAWGSTPLSAATPLQCDSATYSINTSTGDLQFFPNVYQRDVVVYNIEEHRAGVLVGTSQREMTVLVISCGTGFPCIPASTTAVPITKADQHNIYIYPNPAHDELNIKMDEGAYNSFIINNNVGQVVIQQQLTNTQTNVNVSALPEGVYYITLKGDNGTKVQKFVKW